ncbi:hypothetical protein BP5796_06013 [Coleophoma crateriformis]|uniref:mRNA export factor MEX67 n=1 Tax=Coleophoma crateriformis TaxID=565419 RepID=A0A3D8RWH2_9HELO|nr:hypothetical protein BP5796_06013 [Coleophoma crateriformis]
MMKRNAAPPTGPRNGSSTIRSKGGIQKRRNGPVRVDKDGDLDMEATNEKSKAGKGRLDAPSSSRGAKAGRGGNAQPRNSLVTQKAQQAILRGLSTDQASIRESRISKGNVYLKVDGLKSSKAASNPDGGIANLLSFLERKAKPVNPKSSKKVKIKKSSKDGDSVIITTSEEDSEAILKLNGFNFAGSDLAIQITTAPKLSSHGKKGEKKEVSDETKELQDKLKGILSSRYDTSLKLLNLSNLGADPGLIAIGIFNETTEDVSKLFPALMKVCDSIFTTKAQKREAIVSVSLADNSLANVSPVTTLAQTFPDLKNLDLSRNMLSDRRALEAWRWKFRKLENLVLTGNPIETSDPEYGPDLVRWFPQLQTLSGIQVRSPEEVAEIIEKAKSPIPIRGADFRDISQVAENFLRQFFTLYDTNRPQLAAAFYDNDSQHSISVNTAAPRGANNSVPTPPWADYIKHSRNLTKITHAPAKMARRHKGVEAIQKLWSTLPATRHPDILTQSEKYLADCHTLPGLPDPTGQSPYGVDGLIVTIHGEFEEDANSISGTSLRSFSRTFTLAPGAPGGPQIRVLNDVLLIRAWAPLATPTHVTTPPPLVNDQQKASIFAKLVEMTGMTPQYAELCLNDTAWNLEQAFVAFNNNKDKLPANAFLAPGTTLQGLMP